MSHGVKVLDVIAISFVENDLASLWESICEIDEAKMRARRINLETPTAVAPASIPMYHPVLGSESHPMARRLCDHLELDSNSAL
jgi:hypothetical protein